MQIAFQRLPAERHRVTITRSDGSTEAVELDSKDFLRHDFAHLAFELEAGLRAGVWGSVAAGGSLDGTGLDGVDVVTAERVVGPLQTLIRTEGGVDEILELLEERVPDLASRDLAERIHERIRRLLGHWNGTPYGESMEVDWPFR